MIIHPLCVQVSSTDQKLEDITNAVLEALSVSCTNCTITSDIIDEQYFVCYPESPLQVTYRARLEGTSETDSGSLISLIEEWVNGGVNLIVARIQMTVDSKCPVGISSLSEGECEQPTTKPTTSVLTNSPSVFPDSPTTSSSHQSSPDYTGAIIGGIVAIILIISITIVIVVIVALVIVKHRQKDVSIWKAEE